MTRLAALLFLLLAAPAVQAQAAPKAVDFSPLDVVAKKELADSPVPGAAPGSSR